MVQTANLVTAAIYDKQDLVDRLTLNEIMLTMAYGGGNGE